MLGEGCRLAVCSLPCREPDSLSVPAQHASVPLQPRSILEVGGVGEWVGVEILALWCGLDGEYRQDVDTPNRALPARRCACHAVGHPHAADRHSTTGHSGGRRPLPARVGLRRRGRRGFEQRRRSAVGERCPALRTAATAPLPPSHPRPAAQPGPGGRRVGAAQVCGCRFGSVVPALTGLEGGCGLLQVSCPAHNLSTPHACPCLTRHGLPAPRACNVRSWRPGHARVCCPCLPCSLFTRSPHHPPFRRSVAAKQGIDTDLDMAAARAAALADGQELPRANQVGS